MTTTAWRERLAAILFEPPLRGIVERIPILRAKARGHRRTHPFDREHGVETSGFLAVSAIQSDAALSRQMNCYAGCQPSIVRRLIEELPTIDGYSFVDLGCGKGRALAVASEFDFKRVVGVELSDRLAATARDNAAIIRGRYPDRVPIEIVTGNAIHFRLGEPDGRRVVYFYYNSFPASVMDEFLRNLSEQAARPDTHLFVIYYNPGSADLFDKAPALTRWSAVSIPYDPMELGYGPDETDTVVVWQSRPEAYAARPGHARRLFVGDDPHHVEIE